MHQKQFYVGVDWASQSHHVCVLQADGDRLGEQVFKHTGEGLARMAGWILKLAQSEPELVQVAIEVPHGPVVESLLNRGFQVHSINPRQLDRFRDRFSPAGAKDDSRDAHVLAAALRTDPRCLRRLEPLDPLLVELREWSRLSSCERKLRTRRLIVLGSLMEKEHPPADLLDKLDRALDRDQDRAFFDLPTKSSAGARWPFHHRPGQKRHILGRNRNRGRRAGLRAYLVCTQRLDQ